MGKILSAFLALFCLIFMTGAVEIRKPVIADQKTKPKTTVHTKKVQKSHKKTCNLGDGKSVFYDVIVAGTEMTGKKLDEAAKNADKDFRKVLASVCRSLHVKWKIGKKTGPDQINFKLKLSYDILLYGDEKNTAEVDEYLDFKYRDPPDDTERF